jgi:ACS family hexuronate transporter-like MFS transporter
LRPIPNLRWYIAALLFASTVINYIDRQVLSIVAPVLSKELNLSPSGYANILNAFLIAYTLMYLGSGVLVDRWGTRQSLSAFVGWWSVAGLLHGFVRNSLQLGICRFLLGIGEPGNFMASFRAVSEWYPARERAFVNGLVQAGASIGAMIATPLVAWITLRYNWRAAFVATGCIGFAWLAAWRYFYHLPAQHPRISDQEKQLIAEGQVTAPEAPAGHIGFLGLLRYRQTWGLLLSRFFSDPVWWFYLFWLPKYLVDKRGFTLAEVGMLAWVPYLTADLGSTGGGWLSGWLVNRGVPVSKARAMSMLPFALMMPLSFVVGGTSSNTTAMAIICLITFAHMAWKTNLVTVTNDVYPVHVVGSVSGIVAFGNGLGGTLFTWLTGLVVERFGYDMIFAVMGLMHPFAFLIFRWLVRGPIAYPSPGGGPNSDLTQSSAS